MNEYSRSFSTEIGANFCDQGTLEAGNDTRHAFNAAKGWKELEGERSCCSMQGEMLPVKSKRPRLLDIGRMHTHHARTVWEEMLTVCPFLTAPLPRVLEQASLGQPQEVGTFPPPRSLAHLLPHRPRYGPPQGENLMMVRHDNITDHVRLAPALDRPWCRCS